MTSSNSTAFFLRPPLMATALVAVFMLSGCEDGAGFLTKAPEGEAPAAAASAGADLVERDVEAPEVFEASEAGLWDGRPSLGGVWAAHPDVADPERVIIRNEANGKFVIGALFRKERETPGPRIQVSSDAASELGMLAGAPTELYVVALRRETVAVGAPIAEEPAVSDFDAPADVSSGEIAGASADVVGAASAAIDAARAPDAPVIETAAAPEPAPAPAPRSSLEKPYVQIGIFSVEENAQNTAQVMRGAGIVPTVLEQSSSGKKFWRVIVGPAQTRSEQRALLETIRGKGFEDAYAVTN